jgi:serine/threonine-protein kinase
LTIDPKHLEPGFTLGNYTVIEKIGQGGNATLYRAEQVNLKRIVALKIISADYYKDPEFIAMFNRETEAMAKLHHPNIVEVYDAGTVENNLSYLAMELIEGGSLQEKIYQSDSLSLKDIILICIKISDALHYGHEELQLTHGDLKPGNIMLNFNGEPKLADFGLAETAFHCQKSHSTKVYATPHYASPETISGKRKAYDIKSDIYSFGCMIYHLIAGHPPFQAESLKTLIVKHLKHKPPELKKTVPGTPVKLSNLVTSMMAKSPKDRPDSWHEIRDELNEIFMEQQHPLKASFKKHWRRSFSYSKNEMLILMFVLSSLLLLIKPWIGSTILLVMTLFHYIIHFRRDKTKNDT